MAASKNHQVGIDPAAGRHRIAAEVLGGMRQYRMVAGWAKKNARKERIKKSLSHLKHDPMGEKSILRLEPLPLISTDMKKGKGLIFDFGKKNAHPIAKKLMGAEIQEGKASSALFCRDSMSEGQSANFSHSACLDLDSPRFLERFS